MYLQAPPIVARDGCLWNSTVFSNGAIIERRQQPWFFSVHAGKLAELHAFDAARVGRELAPPGSVTQRHSPP
jgi:hypothetical protein